MTAKKCIVLDLDNTLWGGVVGEDGLQGLSLSLTPPGNSFVAFQQALLDLYHRGIILAINSRNNPEEALAVIRTHPNMILKDHHFAATRINWNDKAQNLRELAAELNIGLDSMVFLDDDPANRELVKALLPAVETPELPVDPTQYVRFLNALPYFDTEIITDEDKMRGNLYVTERLRKEEEKNYADKEAFLTSLAMELSVYQDNQSCLPRLSQLTEKTNQFNTNKQPLTETEIKSFIENPDYHVFHTKLLDKFGDHGVIAFALIKQDGTNWEINSLLMSCRVFGRGVEDALWQTIVGQAKEQGVARITIAFKATEKNIPAQEFISKHFNNREYVILETPHFSPWIKIQYENI